MAAEPLEPIREAIDDLQRSVARARMITTCASDEDAGRAAIAALQAADRLTAIAVGLLARTCGVERATGLPAEYVLRLDARAMGWEARELCRATEMLRQMPNTIDALDSGSVSWSQARATLRAIKDRNLDAAARSTVDELIGRRAPMLTRAEPEQLVGEAEDLCADLRADLEQARQARAIEDSYLVFQARFDGGGTLFGQADPEAFAIICQAVDHAAERPVNRDEAEPGHRGRQRMDALLGICEARLAGDSTNTRTAGGDDQQTRTRPLPRLYATIDIETFARGSAGARILAASQGRPLRLSALPAETLACDADVIPIVFDRGQPIAVGEPVKTVTDKLRHALIARDGGCRFPGCHAPAAWTDVHHLQPGVNRMSKLLLLCRRCHWRVHHRGWKITIQGDQITFHHRYRTHISYPRGRPPPGR